MPSRRPPRELRPPRCRCAVRLEVLAGGRAVRCPSCRALMLLDPSRFQPDSKEPRQ